MPRLRAAPRMRLGERHQDLLQDLERIFLAEGFRDLTVDGLAARLKCSKRTLYEIAPSKQEIFLYVLKNFLERIRHKGTLGAFQHDAPADRIRAYMEPGFVEPAAASERFLEDVRSFAPALALIESHQRERVSVLQDIVEDGIRRGEFSALHSQIVAEAYHAAIDRMNNPDLLRMAGVSYAEAFSELFELFAFGLVSHRKSRSGSASGTRRR